MSGATSSCAEHAGSIRRPCPCPWKVEDGALGLTPHVHHAQLEFYTLEYAESLGVSQQTWPLAAEYLAWCPVHGRSSLIRLLEGLPLTSGSERMAIKAIQASQHCASCMRSAIWL